MMLLPLIVLCSSFLQIESRIHRVCDGNSLYIWCEKGQSLFILGAYYVSRSGLYCSSPITCLKVVSEICNFEQSCTIPIGNFTFQNDCSPGFNDLFVQYDCTDTFPGQLRCGLNEEWSNCKSACPRMCPNPATPQPESCTKQCADKGCQCKENYLRDSCTGICLKRENCPIPDDKHIVFSECANDQEYCKIKVKPPQNQNITTTTPTTPNPEQNICEPGYKCKYQYVKDPISKYCVLPEGCPKF